MYSLADIIPVSRGLWLSLLQGAAQTVLHPATSRQRISSGGLSSLKYFQYVGHVRASQLTRRDWWWWGPPLSISLSISNHSSHIMKQSPVHSRILNTEYPTSSQELGSREEGLMVYNKSVSYCWIYWWQLLGHIDLENGRITATLYRIRLNIVIVSRNNIFHLTG